MLQRGGEVAELELDVGQVRAADGDLVQVAGALLEAERAAEGLSRAGQIAARQARRGHAVEGDAGQTRVARITEDAPRLGVGALRSDHALLGVERRREPEQELGHVFAPTWRRRRTVAVA